MFAWLSTAILLFFSILLGACSNSKHTSEVSKSFRSRISESGLKHFELRLYVPRDALPDPSRDDMARARNAQQRNGGRNSFERIEKLLTSAADYSIEQNKYCREGYWILDLNIDLKGPYLRGECNDLASAEDRERFPTTISKW